VKHVKRLLTATVNTWRLTVHTVAALLAHDPCDALNRIGTRRGLPAHWAMCQIIRTSDGGWLGHMESIKGDVVWVTDRNLRRCLERAVRVAKGIDAAGMAPPVRVSADGGR